MKNSVLLIIFGVVLLAGVLFFWFYSDEVGDVQDNLGGPEAPEVVEEEEVEIEETETAEVLEESVALAVLADDLTSDECLSEGIEGWYQSCTVNLTEEGSNEWAVTVTYDGLYDDSVQAIRYESVLSHDGSAWVAGPVSETYRCQSGRGQEDFASDLCL